MKNIDNNKEISTVTAIVENELSCKVLNCSKTGAGANGNVYKITIDIPPYTVAVKSAKNGSLLIKEKAYTDFILSKTDIPMPRTLFLKINSDENERSYMCMEFLDGVNANDPKLLLRGIKAKAQLRDSVIENLEKLQSVKGDKYGSFDSLEYDDWHDYYRPFSEKVILFAEDEAKKGNIIPYVAGVMRKAFDNYDKVFSEPISKPTLTHGDFWLPNILVDRKSLRVTGVLDPFNVMWADSHYELFALIAGRENKYKIYDTYKKLHNISDKCDLKLEYYALFSEMYWYSITHHKFDDFLKLKARLLNKQLRRFNII